MTVLWSLEAILKELGHGEEGSAEGVKGQKVKETGRESRQKGGKGRSDKTRRYLGQHDKIGMQCWRHNVNSLGGRFRVVPL